MFEKPSYEELEKRIKELEKSESAYNQTEKELIESEKYLSQLSRCFINFTHDTRDNINKLTSLCGEVFGGTCALYNRIDQGILYSWGQWNTPPDYNPIDKPDGHICYDVIKNDSNSILVVPDLQTTVYAQTDPNVLPYKLQTYVGKAVKFNNKNIGSLCVVFQDKFVPKESQKKLMGIIASMIGVEEERMQAEKEKIIAQQHAATQSKQALVGEIAGKMAHDFNNVLGVIMGSTELSLLDCEEIETRKTLELILEQTLRGRNITKNLVAFAKDKEPIQEFFRISEKINLVLNLLKMDLKGIEVIKEDKSGTPDLIADPSMIEHGLINLIQNSIHAVSLIKHPKIAIRTYTLDNNLFFEIEDNGCGIPKEYIEKIYEPSFSLKGNKDINGSYKSGIKGAGYGLANVKKYIGQHKGSILVESAMNSGTKFTIKIPVIKKELTSEEKIEIQKKLSHFEKRILLVEDEQAISDVQYRILTQKPCNHKVDTASNGQVAIDLFDRNEYDLVSLDYVLPGGINGMNVYNHIRGINKTIPILFISGNIEFLESIKELKQKDVYIDHLSKPCQNKDYVQSINKLLKQALTEQ
jgi:two-component system, cell cycle sensor histidine kinase and response regulator CckA